MTVLDRVWLGTYDNYADAELSFGFERDMAPSLFAHREWLDRQASLAHQIAPDDGQTQRPPRPTSLPFAAALVGARVIVDFGGGSGWVYELLHGSPGDPDRYLVIDVDTVVHRFAEMATSRLKFATVHSSVVDELAGETDILYSNSALQYLPDNAALCSVVERVRPSWVLLDEVLWSATGQDWFTIQVNSVVPAVARFAAIDRLEADLASRGYRLMWKDRFGLQENYTFPVMDHLPPEVRIPHALALAFARRPDVHVD